MILGTIHNLMRDILINSRKRRELTNTNFSVICNDCTGGMVLHDFKMKFCSPTINMWCSAVDYIKFVTNLKYYLSLEPKEEKNDQYPIMVLEDIKWHCIHYKSFDEAKTKWNNRKKRIDYNNIYLIFNDRNGCTEKELKQFDSLQYNHKVCFVHREWVEYKSCVCIPGSEDKECIDTVTLYLGKFRLKRRYDYFDFVRFFNETD